MSSPPELHVEQTYATVARADLVQAVLSAGGRPFSLRIASEVFPRIYIADVFTARKLEILRELAITHVVSALDFPIVLPPELALKTLHVPLVDAPASDLLSHLPVATQFITAALEDGDARVLVHCWQGVSRSASLVAAYLIASQNMSAQDAIALLKSKRTVIQPNSGFLRQLRQYEALVRAEVELQLDESTR